VVPANQINPIATKLLSYYPDPNQAGVGKSNTSNFFSNAPERTTIIESTRASTISFNDHQSAFRALRLV